MNRANFEIGARVIECPRCGAPVRGPREGGEILCGACGAPDRMAPRDDRPPSALPSPSDEIDRLARLRIQAEHPAGGHAYDLHPAPLGWSAADLAARGARERLLREWTAARAAGVGTAEEGRRLLWLALRRADAERAAGQPAKARAALETALELLPDAGHRQLARFRLAAEALAEGDAASAEGWLSPCDPAPRVLEIDGAWREIRARVKAAQGDPRGVLEATGERAETVPVHPDFAASLTAYRVHALESLGHLDEGRAELAAATDAARATLAREALAPRLREEGRRSALAALAAQRDQLPTGLAALRGPLATIPALALAGLVAVTIPRCFFDADPFLGAHGYVLCPHRCEGCTGPLRVYTAWSHSGGEHSTNGPDYYCASPGNRVATMSERELEGARHQLDRYELSFAPAAATYLTFLLLLLPLVPILGLRGHRGAARRRAELEEAMATLASTLSPPADPPERAPGRAALGSWSMLVIGPALVALAVIALELSVRR